LACTRYRIESTPGKHWANVHLSSGVIRGFEPREQNLTELKWAHWPLRDPVASNKKS